VVIPDADQLVSTGVGFWAGSLTLQPGDLFTAIDHVGVAVRDLDAGIASCRDTYGMTLTHEEVNEEQGVREAMMDVGESGSCIQLLAPLSPESTIAAFLDRSGPGVQQVAYRVADLDAVSATLRERGLRLLFDAPRRGTTGSRVNFIHPKDAGGILVELVEPAARLKDSSRTPDLQRSAGPGKTPLEPEHPSCPHASD
jgi:methylmalonyl-CoA/ethylmalonyl-CoA epimerase